MKPITHLCCAAAMLLASCSGADKTSAPVARADSRCPIPIENVGFISSIGLHADTLVYVCNVTEPGISLKAMAGKADAMKRTMAPTITTLFDTDPELLDELRKHKWILSVRYHDTRGGAVTLDFHPDELSENAIMATAATINPEQRLADEIALSRSSLPARMADAITITDVVDINGYVVFECSVDESIAGDGAMANLKENAAGLRASMAEALASEGNPDVERLVDVTTAAGRGISYRYTGSESGDTMSVAFSPQELVR